MATTKVCGTRLAMAVATVVVLAMVAMARRLAMVEAMTTVVIRHLVAMDLLIHMASSTAVCNNVVLLIIYHYQDLE